MEGGFFWPADTNSRHAAPKSYRCIPQTKSQTTDHSIPTSNKDEMTSQGETKPDTVESGTQSSIQDPSLDNAASEADDDNQSECTLVDSPPATLCESDRAAFSSESVSELYPGMGGS